MKEDFLEIRWNWKLSCTQIQAKRHVWNVCKKMEEFT